MALWTEEFRPRTLAEIELPSGIRKTISTWMTDYQKPLYLYGCPGGGKTSLVHCLAEELKCECLEFNASSLRGARELKEMRENLRSRNIWGKPILVLFDEIELCVEGMEFDSWKAPYRVCFTSNTCLPKLRKMCVSLEIQRLDDGYISQKLFEIAGLKRVSTTNVAEIVRLSKGDIRKAITRFQFDWLVPEEASDEPVKGLRFVFQALTHPECPRYKIETVAKLARVIPAESPLSGKNYLSIWSLWRKQNPEHGHGEAAEKR